MNRWIPSAEQGLVFSTAGMCNTRTGRRPRVDTDSVAIARWSSLQACLRTGAVSVESRLLSLRIPFRAHSREIALRSKKKNRLEPQERVVGGILAFPSH